jgi:hypothetical protein
MVPDEGEQSEGNTGTHESEGRVWCASLSLCQFCSGERAIGEMIGHRQLCECSYSLADTVFNTVSAI